jgi:tetratricopeptide (TPR) repeat protein
MILCLVLCFGIVGNSLAAEKEDRWEKAPLLPSDHQEGPANSNKRAVKTKDGSKSAQFEQGVFGILVSEFRATNKEQKAKADEIQGTIVRTLNARFTELGIQSAKVKSIPSRVSHALHSHQDAMKIGREYKASMVIWGDITMVGVIPNITISDRGYQLSTIIKPETTLLKDGLTFISLSESREIRLPALTQEPTAIVCFATALSYYFENKFEKALVFFKAALPDNPGGYIDSAPIFLYMANAMYLRGEYDQAITFYTKSLELNPLCAMSFNNRGSVYAMQNRREQALADYNEALKIDSRLALALSNRGVYYFEGREYSKALADFNNAIAADPKYAGAHVNRGRVFQAIGEHEKAIEDFARAIEIDPKDPASFVDRGIYYISEKKYDLAISDLNKAVELNPKELHALYNRALSYQNINQSDKALSDYDSVIEIAPEVPFAYINRGIIYQEVKRKPELAISDFTRAIEIYDRHQMINSDAALAYYNRGNCYSAQGNYDKAISDYTKALGIQPNMAEAYHNRGIAYKEKGNYREAELDYSKATEIKPDLAEAYFAWGEVLRLQQKHEQAIAKYREAIKLNPIYGVGAFAPSRYYPELRNW